jgi:hypothetical protein
VHRRTALSHCTIARRPYYCSGDVDSRVQVPGMQRSNRCWRSRRRLRHRRRRRRRRLRRRQGALHPQSLHPNCEPPASHRATLTRLSRGHRYPAHPVFGTFLPPAPASVMLTFGSKSVADFILNWCERPASSRPPRPLQSSIVASGCGATAYSSAPPAHQRRRPPHRPSGPPPSRQ